MYKQKYNMLLYSRTINNLLVEIADLEADSKFSFTVKRQFQKVLGCHFSEPKIVNIDGMQFSEFIMNKLN